MQERPPVQLAVCGIGGHLCLVAADASWTVREVKSAISKEIAVPVSQQVLLHGVRECFDEEALNMALSSSGRGELPAESEATLTLIRLEEPPSPHALWSQVRKGDSKAALETLSFPRLAGLNDVDQAGSILHTAISRDLNDVAVAILAHREFRQVNHRDRVHGWTALHRAACRGSETVCKAILARPDFSEQDGKVPFGMTAADLARANGHKEVAQLLEAAESHPE